ncbi:MAG: inositol monophosphatase [Lachnospiraceae bacterium]|nr:inositol monophosphatase [Lachnospiraceae bacterium]
MTINNVINTDQKLKIEEIIKQAGSMILSAHLKDSDIHQKKGPANYVTDYDVKIQEFLILELSKLFPGCAFFGEEDTAGNEQQVEEGYTFFIDPIDGTTNFLFDYHNSCVSIGLALNGQMAAGWVYHPYTDQLWSAVKGDGAYLNNKLLKLNDSALNEGICAFGCARYNEGDKVFKVIEELFMNSLSIRNGGSAAIDLCRIASGSNVGYVEMKLQPYDYAAASVIITEAGGEIGQADGSPITLDKPCSIVAGTHRSAAKMREIING